MQFKVKDLAIGVSAHKLVDLDKLCLFPTKWCRYFISSIPCRPCTFLITDIIDCTPCSILNSRIPTDGPCGVAHSTCYNTELFVLDVRELVINPGDIDLVREQFGEFLNVVQARGEEVTKAMTPQSVEQIDLVEGELKAALAEVQALRKQLK